MIEKIKNILSQIRENFQPRAQQSFQTALPRVAFRTATKLSEQATPVLRGQILPSDVFAQNHGLLPAFAWHADRLAQASLGFESGLRYVSDDQSITGFRCVFSEPPAFASAYLLFFQEAMHDAWEFLPKNEHDHVLMDDVVDMFALAIRHQAAPHDAMEQGGQLAISHSN